MFIAHILKTTEFPVIKQAERAGRNVLCVVMGSSEYKSLYIIYLLKNWCIGGMLSYCVAVFYHVLSQSWDFFSSVSPGKIKASLIFFLQSVCFTESPLDIGTVPQEARRLYHLSTPWSPPPHLHTHPSSPRRSKCATIPFASRPALANLFTLRRCPQGQGGQTSQSRRRPYPLSLSSRDICSWLCLKCRLTLPCQCLSKRHYRQLWTIHSKNTGLKGGFVFLKSCLYPI